VNYTLKKIKKIKISSYIRKFEIEQSKSYMIKGLLIYD
jgi:hypothetical protein